MNRIYLLARALPVAILLANADNTRAGTNYLGAAVVLQQLADKQSAAPSEKKETSESVKLKRDVESFKKELAGLKSEDAAGRWLALFDRQQKLPPEELAEAQMDRYQGGDDKSKESFDPQEIWNALPPPAAWSALRTLIEARPPEKGRKAVAGQALRLFAHTLAVDRNAQTNDLAALETIFNKSDAGEKYMLANTLDQINQVMAENSEDAAIILKMLDRQLAAGGENEYNRDLNIPDLVTLVGKEKAEAFLRKALVKPDVNIELAQGADTQKLARQLALELIVQLKRPQWKLTQSLTAVELFEAMEKQFPQSSEADTNDTDAALLGLPGAFRAQLSQFGDERTQARTYYLLGLIVGGRAADAVAVAEKLGKAEGVSLPSEALKELDRQGHTRAIHDFFRELLTKNPDLPYWDEYIPLAARVGQTDKMLELARRNAAREDLSTARRNLIRKNLARALFAAGEVDEGVKELQQLFDSKDEDSDSRQFSSEKGQLALQLAKVGKLLNRPEWAETGVRYAREAVTNKTSRTDSYTSSWTLKALASFLVENGRGPEAEALLTEALARQAKQRPTPDQPWNNNTADKTLATLAGVYSSAGRQADVLALLDQSPLWNGKDLADLGPSDFDMMIFSHSKAPKESSLNYVAARALASLGRKPEARKIVDALLDKNGGSDPVYELLIELGGDDLLARLDAVYAHDQFEERPLIWKAELLRRAGKLEEAEVVVRRAIAIDPSDGEQGPGDRMRAYSVLVEIRAALGDTNQATVFRGAVTAIRHAEKADQYYEAGLLKQAVKMYEESLTHFADAYCIQSRLALQLSELGMHEAAEEHYRRAYELMPESFGRVESHCFGCERAFDGERAQSVAEKVFTRLAQTTPDKPQVHYLLGYLREEQARNDEALAHYRQAVKLDPDYLNAWKHIQSVGEQRRLPAADKDAVAFTLLRLDPLNRHGTGRNFSGVTDLPQLWVAVESALKLAPPEADSLYPLVASQARLEQEKAESKEKSSLRERITQHVYYSRNRDKNTLQPARAVLQNRIISALLPLLGGNGYSSYSSYESIEF